MAIQIILASGSPRRKQLLEQAGIPHIVLVSNADETVSGSPEAQVTELALRKANATALLAKQYESPIIIAADTLVYIDGEVLGKPDNPKDAFDMLTKLQGRTHEVYTGVALVYGDKSTTFVCTAEVTFRTLSPEEINAYIATGEPFDKAGAYGIQGRGSVLVEHIKGDFYTVMGLPIAKLCESLMEMGYKYWL